MKKEITTEKAKHTPGPWTYCCDSGHSSKCLRGVRHSKKAAVHGGPDNRTIASHVESYDDARLIAAAPELLEALKALLIHDDIETREHAREAIAKAEGK